MIAGVLLAAGASRRMGRPKLLLPWGKTSVLGHLLQQWNELRASQIAVVHAPDAKPLAAEMDRLGFPAGNRIVNPAPENGMFSSIQCAANWQGWKPELTQWVITLGDQPHLKPATLQTLLEFGARNPEKICQPMRGERRKHPVIPSGARDLARSSSNSPRSSRSPRDEESTGWRRRDQVQDGGPA